MKLAFVLAQQMLAAGTMLPIEMWRAAEEARIASRQDGTTLEILTVAVSENAVATQSGLDLTPTHLPEQTGHVDVVYLPALWRNPRPSLRASAAINPWLTEQFSNGCLLAAVGTGCCFLAEAALLDGKSATTHWHYLDRFQHDYPRVVLKRDYFITQSGSIFCAASVNALADVTVYLIERVYGQHIATKVERNFSHEIRRPYEKYRYLDGDDLQHSDELVIEIQLWMKRHLGESTPIPDIADRFGLSQRSLIRRFRRAIGIAPLEYLQTLRINTAKELLESTNLTIAEIAFRVGYQDQGHFGRLFVREMTVSPRQYRQTVRAKVFSGNPARNSSSPSG